jgi:hypothetical protein
LHFVFWLILVLIQLPSLSFALMLRFYRYSGEPRHISTPGEGTILSSGKYSKMAMKGKEVYKFATREVPVVLQEALTAAGMTVEDVDWLLLHQVCCCGRSRSTKRVPKRVYHNCFTRNSLSHVNGIYSRQTFVLWKWWRIDWVFPWTK